MAVRGDGRPSNDVKRLKSTPIFCGKFLFFPIFWWCKFLFSYFT